MTGFDAEVRQSLRQIEAAVAAVQSKNDQANRSLRQTVAELKMVAAGHREAASAAGAHAGATRGATHEIHALGRGAALAGGHGGHLVHSLLRLSSFNPIAIAAGLGIGFISDKAIEVVQHMREVNKEMDDLAGKAHQLENDAIEKAVGGANVQGAAKRGFNDFTNADAFSDVPAEFKGQAKAAARMAVISGGAASEEEALGRMTKANAFRHRESGAFGSSAVAQIGVDQLAAIGAGFEGDAAAFGSDVRAFSGTRAGQSVITAMDQQAGEKIAQSARAAYGLQSATGQDGLQTALENIRRELYAQTDLMKSERDRTWFGATSTIEAAASARVADLQVQQAVLLSQISVTNR